MSSSWLPYFVREHELNDVESRLSNRPDSIELLLTRAHLLTELDRIEEAKSTYLKAVTLAPTDLNLLNDFGKLLFDSGFRSAAGTLFRQAIAHHPGDPASSTNLGNVCYLNGDLAAARECFERALALSPDQREAHRGLSYVLRDLGEEAASRQHAESAFKGNSVVVQPYRGKNAPIRILQLVSGVGGNAAVERFLDNRTFLSTVIVAEYFDTDMPLPAHEVLINAIADADLSSTALDAAEKIVQKTSAAIVNHPRAIKVTTRAQSTKCLAAIPSVLAPKTLNLPRASLTTDHTLQILGDHGFEFPILLRSPGFHTGQYFERVENLDQLEGTLTKLPGQEVMVIQYLDSRGPDGKFRKYRVMMIDGELLPLHLAISRDWKVHYFTAEMADYPEHRRQDAAFLENMTLVLGEKAVRALHEIQKALGLDYAGIDFGISVDGKLILFEANAAMNVLPPGPDERWNYRRPHVQRILDTARGMIVRKAKTS
jgi:tetratricopeptide (TPR) repeat protein